MNKYEEGLKAREEIIGKLASDGVTESLKDIAPIVDEYTLRVFADINERPQLTMQQRELITIASLCTQGSVEPQLKLHIKAALNVGLTQEEIAETFVHLISYVGFPKALNAIFALKAVIA